MDLRALRRRLKTNYYVPGADPRPAYDFIKRALARRVPRFPRIVQIETQSGCNAACIFCPLSNKDAARPPAGRMRDQLFEKIVLEIGRVGKTRRISPYLMNEPLVDPELVARSRFIHEQVPGCKVEITTNGGLLRPAVTDEIIRDNPFDAIYISFQGIEKETYERTMRGAVVFEETMSNVEYLLKQCRRYVPGLRIVITMVETNRLRADHAVKYWRAKGAVVQSTVLENRGGTVPVFEEMAPAAARIFRDCRRLFNSACVTFDGDMVLCCGDYYRKVVLGNARERSLAEVWNSEKAIRIRQNFLRGDMRENPLCRSCETCGVEYGS